MSETDLALECAKKLVADVVREAEIKGHLPMPAGKALVGPDAYVSQRGPHGRETKLLLRADPQSGVRLVAAEPSHMTVAQPALRFDGKGSFLPALAVDHRKEAVTIVLDAIERTWKTL